LVNNGGLKGRCNLIQIRIDELLEERGRTFYWLSKETGISHTTLRTLSCQPGDVLRLADESKAGRKQAAKGK
jgi:DNA-binding Xre family transcriptional regulator